MLRDDQQKVLDSALWYAEKYGFHIVPGFIDEFDRKRPWLQGWSERASVDPAEIRDWWAARPDSIVGLCCGLSNVIVVDIDVHDDLKNGYRELHTLLQTYGKDQVWFDSLTVMSKSGGGGLHAIFKAPDGIDLTKRKIEWKPGIDILIGGSFLVLPPSPHPSGTAYAWVPGAGPHEREVAELPPELLQDLLKSTDAINPEERLTSAHFEQLLEAGSSGGSRNNDLIRLIGWMRRRIGDTPEAHREIREKLEVWRDRCQPPYRGAHEDDEFERTWQSGLRLPHVGFVDWFHDALTNAGFDGETTRDLSLWMEPRVGALLRRDSAGELFLWDGKKWIIDDQKHLSSFGMLDNRWGVIDAFQRDTDSAAAQLELAGQTRPANRLRAWSAKMRERAPMVDAMRMVVGRQDAVRDADWDPHPHLFHCQNGVLDLTNGVLMPHDPGLMNRSIAPVTWNPNARRPLAWLKLLDYMLPGEHEMQRYVLAALGFSLWGDNHQKALFVLHGEANNGKSTLLQSFLRVVGIAQERKTVAYGGLIEKKVMAESRSDQHPAGLADALLKRVGVLSGEWGMSDKLNLELVKAITGDDMLSARFMREDFAVFLPKVTPWIATNHMLQLREFDSSIRARLKLIELHGVIPEQDRKPSHAVRKELEDEADQIFSLVVREMLDARTKGGLAAIEPQALRKAVDEAIDDQDTIKAWANMRLSRLVDPASDAAWVDVTRDQGLPFSALVQDFEMRFHQVNRNLFAQRLVKLLGVKSGELPKRLENGVRERWYPVKWAE